MAMLAVALFLGRSRLGLAVRASAERSDRASMLGIPVGRLNTVVWAVAAGLASLALFLKSGITGVPLGYAVGLPTLLQALAALVIGRLERLPTIVAMALALGVLEAGVQWNSETPFAAYPIMAGVMFVALLVQRTGTSRRENDATSSWRGAEEVRPLAPEVRDHPWVSTLRWTLLAAAIGAAVAAACTSRWHVDLSLALLAGGAAGGLAAFVVGVPALRLRGLYLAVTTFAFGLSVQFWLLNDRFFGWFPRSDQRIERPPLFGRVSVDSPTRFYAYSVVVLALVTLAVRGVRQIGRAHV